MSLPFPPLLLITDRSQVRRPLVEVITSAFEGGCRWVMIREKDLELKNLQRLISDVLALAETFKATVSINSGMATANLGDATGIHLPQNKYDLAAVRSKLEKYQLLGISAHNLIEGRAAKGADYITISPVFETASKPGYGPALGEKGLAQIVRSLNIPVIGLGGVEPSNISKIRNVGAAGAAVMGGVMRAKNPKQKVSDLIAAWHG